MEPLQPEEIERRGKGIVIVVVVALILLFAAIALVALYGDDGTSSAPAVLVTHGFGVVEVLYGT